MRFGTTVLSNWNTWPTVDEPDGKWKFFSTILQFSQDMKIIERSTYSGLEWLGDLGGLYCALIIIGQFLVKPFSILSLKIEMVSKVFRLSPKQSKKVLSRAFT